jgi:hypothetical protein
MISADELDPLHAMQFGLFARPRSGMCAQPSASSK